MVHVNGWHFDHGPETYIAREPQMTHNEYDSYRAMWIAVYGHHDVCENPLCRLDRIEPPPERPEYIRDVYLP